MTADWRATLEQVERLLDEYRRREALALLRGLLAEPQQRQYDAEGRPLCFVCRRPQGEHPNGEECLAEPQVNPSEAKDLDDEYQPGPLELMDPPIWRGSGGLHHVPRAGLLAEGEESREP